MRTVTIQWMLRTFLLPARITIGNRRTIYKRHRDTIKIQEIKPSEYEPTSNTPTLELPLTSLLWVSITTSASVRVAKNEFQLFHLSGAHVTVPSMEYLPVNTSDAVSTPLNPALSPPTTCPFACTRPVWTDPSTKSLRNVVACRKRSCHFDWKRARDDDTNGFWFVCWNHMTSAIE